MKIGIIKETKVPLDNRAPLTPSQCAILKEENPEMEITVQSCNYRCYTDEEYRYQGIEVIDEVSDCEVLLGVKEIPAQYLIANKTYFIFSHVIKKQPHNQKLLKTVLEKNIRLIDWETLRDEQGKRLIAFGRWAGIVGAYHAVRMIGLRTKMFSIKQMSECHNFAEVQKEFLKLRFPKMKVVLTGTGRVSNGASFLLDLVGIRCVSPHDFCYKQYDEIVYTQLASADMYHREGAEKFDTADFHAQPSAYSSNFYPFTKTTDMLINGIYWDKRYPVFFTKEEMKEKDFSIKQIADVTCDIAPNASIPSTLRTSSIEEPYYGYDVQKEQIVKPFLPNVVDVMAIDNLPNELPRDASEDFGNMLMSRILPELKKPGSKIIYNATIADKGKLNEPYLYLSDYAHA
jgi:saccharopine dehydrogenase (NAD+, L-lysine-forming)